MANIDKVLVYGSSMLVKCAEDVLNQNQLWVEWRAWDKEQRENHRPLVYEESVVQYVYSILNNRELQTFTFEDNLITDLKPSINSEELLRAVKWMDDNQLWDEFSEWFKPVEGNTYTCSTAKGILEFWYVKTHTDDSCQSEIVYLSKAQQLQQVKLMNVIRFITDKNLWREFIDWYFSSIPYQFVESAICEFAENHGWANAQLYK